MTVFSWSSESVRKKSLDLYVQESMVSGCSSAIDVAGCFSGILDFPTVLGKK
jgi:hypothetical protein